MNSSAEAHSGQTVLAITGMTCGGCVSTMTRVLQKVAGVTRAEVDLASARAVVEGSAAPAQLVAAAEAAGFGASIVGPRAG